jgi:hypothetical protein
MSLEKWWNETHWEKEEVFGANPAKFQLFLPNIPRGACYLFIVRHEIRELFAEQLL